MAKNRKTPDMNLPVWFDGQNINEALFCEDSPMQRLQNWTKFKVGAVFWLELQAIINR